MLLRSRVACCGRCTHATVASGGARRSVTAVPSGANRSAVPVRCGSGHHRDRCVHTNAASLRKAEAKLCGRRRADRPDHLQLRSRGLPSRGGGGDSLTLRPSTRPPAAGPSPASATSRCQTTNVTVDKHNVMSCKNTIMDPKPTGAAAGHHRTDHEPPGERSHANDWRRSVARGRSRQSLRARSALPV